ncbi:MAG: hypothetical protein FJ265_16595 [Planctomycetes bacterium]|nr:hypothetical protein [Planctomycetota bacterium]
MGNPAGNRPGTAPAVAPHDPENDIDARSATKWVLGGTVVFFLALWLMLPVFTRVQEHEQQRKIDAVPAAEYGEVLARQRDFLTGGNPTKRTIDQVLKDMAAGK